MAYGNRNGAKSFLVFVDFYLTFVGIFIYM